VDALPNKLYRYTGTNWMQLDKETTDTYLNDDYVKHLTWLVRQGHMELEELTEQEQEEVKTRL
tara:strand:- start:1444 stop:1632 length:189 start_codon:yes stop_codon:yes gene_type:complete